MKPEKLLQEPKTKICETLNELDEINSLFINSHRSKENSMSFTSQETLLLMEQMLVQTRVNLVKVKKNLEELDTSDIRLYSRIFHHFNSLVSLLKEYSISLNERINLIYKFLIINVSPLKYKYLLFKNRRNISRLKKKIDIVKLQIEKELQDIRNKTEPIKKFFFMDDNLKKGPFQPVELIKQNIKGNTLVLNDSDHKWVPASEVEEIRKLLEVTPPPINNVPNHLTKKSSTESKNNDNNVELLKTQEDSNVEDQTKKKNFNKPLAYSVAFIACFIAYYVLFILLVVIEAFLLNGIKIGILIKVIFIGFVIRHIWKIVVNQFKK
jgi:hypothetical protein